jgi:hypothetical protein
MCLLYIAIGQSIIYPKKMPQIAQTILMVRPANFGYNPETAANNAFQVNNTSISVIEIQSKALVEFDTFVKKLQLQDIHVVIANDTNYPIKTDAIFPNNWVSFHQDGALITYPMFATTRRAERNNDILQLIDNQFVIHQKISLVQHEAKDKFLEGTGSMVLDRVHKIAYACLSVRTDEAILDEFCAFLGYKKRVFHATDANNMPIYHTNVMMSVATTFVIICMDTIQDAAEKIQLLKSFKDTGKQVIKISLAQMGKFAGNMLQVASMTNVPFLVMSLQAYKSLTLYQKQQIKKHCAILHAPLDTIEQYGGGSARCMMAEVFLEKKLNSEF